MQQSPQDLVKKFSNYKFIALNSLEFLNYEGAEFLLIDKESPDLSGENTDINHCLSHIKHNSLLEHFKAVSSREALVSLLEKEWK